jgi:flavin reductase (DIM6/NTAB) family NADH-FMN oxidoreductase RutF
MEVDPVYGLLRHLTLPLVAITTTANGRSNGLIANSAQRASLVPSQPRISVYISKPNVSHDLVLASGLFTIHLLRADQWDVVEALGFHSAREGRDKLAAFAVRRGQTGCPVLTDVRASFECRVVNAMDAGAATFFLGDVVDVAGGEPGPVMTSDHFRANAPPAMLREYERLLGMAQQYLEPLSEIRAPTWTGPTAGP